MVNPHQVRSLTVCVRYPQPVSTHCSVNNGFVLHTTMALVTTLLQQFWYDVQVSRLPHELH